MNDEEGCTGSTTVVTDGSGVREVRLRDGEYLIWHYDGDKGASHGDRYLSSG
jgi:hypothetical protein